MMKLEWEEPSIEVQNFTPNEYVAACGDTEYGMYKFVCDAGGGSRGDIFVDGENITRNRAGWTSYYYACNTTHESPTTDAYQEGIFYYNNGNDQTTGYESIPVMVWREPIRNRWGTIIRYNIHATTNLNRESWVTTKS